MARRTHGDPSPIAAMRRTPPLPVRRTAALLVGVLAAVVLPSTASAATRALPLPRVFSLRSGAQALPGYWGGVQTTTAGEMVSVYASNSYTQDPARTLAWAEYLA